MGSEPKTSPDAGRPSAIGWPRRVRPRQRRRPPRARARRPATSSVGRWRSPTCSACRRPDAGRSVGATAIDVDHLAVRPPIDYWPWSPDEAEEQPGATAAVVASPALDGGTHRPAQRRHEPRPPGHGPGCGRVDADGATVVTPDRTAVAGAGRAHAPRRAASATSARTAAARSWGTSKLDDLARLLGVGAPVEDDATANATTADAPGVGSHRARAAAARPARGAAVRRALPIATARRGATVAGPATSPGAIASGLRAQHDAPPPGAPDVARRAAASAAPSVTAAAREVGDRFRRRPVRRRASARGAEPGAGRRVRQPSAPARRRASPPRAHRARRAAQPPPDQQGQLVELPPDLQALRRRLEAAGKVAPDTAAGRSSTGEASAVVGPPRPSRSEPGSGSVPGAGPSSPAPAAAGAGRRRGAAASRAVVPTHPPPPSRRRAPGAWREHGQQWRWRSDPTARADVVRSARPVTSSDARSGRATETGQAPGRDRGVAPSAARTSMRARPRRRRSTRPPDRTPIAPQVSPTSPSGAARSCRASSRLAASRSSASCAACRPRWPSPRPSRRRQRCRRPTDRLCHRSGHRRPMR